MSTAPPRRCGIAMFMESLSREATAAVPGSRRSLVALVEESGSEDRPAEASYLLRRGVKRDYGLAARFINRAEADVVNLHHEFSIYGGVWGHDVWELVRRIRKPLVTTCHTILDAPSEEIRRAFEDLLHHSDRIVSPSPSGVAILRDTYGVPDERLRMIPLGVPDVPLLDPSEAKGGLGLGGGPVLLSIGLQSSNKGLETVLRALPRVVATHRDATFLIVGQTHPMVLKGEGDGYRRMLEELTRELGIGRHVAFVDRFVGDEELERYLLAADVVVTPYRELRQTASAVLASAMGMGRAVVSTPYLHARDLLGDGTGLLFGRDCADELADALLRLLGERGLREALQRRAYEKGRSMRWSAVANAYARLFDDARREAPARLSSRRPFRTRGAIDRVYTQLLLSEREREQRLARLLDLARRGEWRAIAAKVARTLSPSAPRRDVPAGPLRRDVDA